MLKITRLSLPGEAPLIKLEGELLAPWLPEVRDAFAGRGWGRRPMGLDLTAVRYADEAGIQLIRELMGDSVALIACSSFLDELLRRESS